MSYTADKYGANYVYPEVPLNVSVSDQVRTMLEVYTEGVRDADDMLGRLRDYVAGREEPVVLVFFGDHLPYLGDNQLGYTELGLSGDPLWDRLTSYATPYVIWANDAAAEALDWETAAESLELPDIPPALSASFLGAAVLELTGRADESAWFRFLNGLRRETPVVQKKTYQTLDGTYVRERDLDQWVPETGFDGQQIRDAVRQWRCWSYYHLRYKDVG